MKFLIQSLASRKKSNNSFGYGLGTAENHVKRFIQSAGNDELASFGVTDEKSGIAAVKRRGALNTGPQRSSSESSLINREAGQSEAASHDHRAGSRRIQDTTSHQVALEKLTELCEFIKDACHYRPPWG